MVQFLILFYYPRHLSVKIYIDQSNMVKIQYKQMHVANCEYSLQFIPI